MARVILGSVGIENREIRTAVNNLACMVQREDERPPSPPRFQGVGLILESMHEEDPNLLVPPVFSPSVPKQSSIRFRLGEEGADEDDQQNNRSQGQKGSLKAHNGVNLAPQQPFVSQRSHYSRQGAESPQFTLSLPHSRKPSSTFKPL